MRDLKWRYLMMAAFAAAALLLSAAQARGETSCVTFSAPLYAYLDPAQGWLGQAWWAFGNAAPRIAGELTNEPVYEKTEGDLLLGTERTTVDFGNGDSFQLITRWLSHHVGAEGGVAEIHEIGTITNGTGKFANVTGIFFSSGTAGPGMSRDQKTFLWLGSRTGTICGSTAR